MISSYPQPATEFFGLDFAQIDSDMNKLMSTVKALRSQISAYKVQGNVKPTIVVQTTEAHELFTKEVAVITSLVKAGETIVIKGDQQPPEGCLKGFVTDEISIYVKVVGLIDIKLETARIEKRIKELDNFKAGMVKKMSIPNYETKVPESIRNDNTEKVQGYDFEIAEQIGRAHV